MAKLQEIVEGFNADSFIKGNEYGDLTLDYEYIREFIVHSCKEYALSVVPSKLPDMLPERITEASKYWSIGYDECIDQMLINIKESAQAVQRCEDEEKWGVRPSEEIQEIFARILSKPGEGVHFTDLHLQSIIVYLDTVWERNKK